MSTSSTENEEIKPFQGHGPNEEAILTQRRNTNDDEVIDTNSILSRRESQLIMNTESVYQTASTSLKPLPPMGDGRPYPQCYHQDNLMRFVLMVLMIQIIHIIFHYGRNSFMVYRWLLPLLVFL